MPIKLILFLAIGTVLMGIPIVIAARKCGIQILKAVLITVLLTVFGTVGTYLMYYIENGEFGGLSFFGAVFLVPIVFFAIAHIIRVPYGQIADLCAVGECIMLALMKVHCILGGCCLGRVLFTNADGKSVLFPSRIVEMLVALALFAFLTERIIRRKSPGDLYPLFLLLYGGTRFVLNIFREAWVTKEMLLPFGNIWSLVAVAAGIIWLIVYKKRRRIPQ